MGYLESAVVVYLRKIYYPEGFNFPLKAIESNIGITEILREAATIIMLAGAGIIAGRTKTEKFGFFIYCFAVWDIFYYIFLKLLLDWPESLLTWDILFLIPVIWVGPVISPVINSLSMIFFAFLISYFIDKGLKTKIIWKEWLLLISGSVIIIISYVEEYLDFILAEFALRDLFRAANNMAIMEYASGYLPKSFSWWIFIIGELLLIIAMVMFYSRNKKDLKIKGE
ncbi:MAG: hypothetical protein ISS18_10090 [Bacteroidales bacterium]|nr:hypothetical protein [Bacteroidales bacterium]